MTLKDVPPGKVFRLQRTGTLYKKMPDGSIRNISKALAKAEKAKRKMIRAFNALPEEAKNELRQKILDQQTKQETTSDQ